MRLNAQLHKKKTNHLFKLNCTLTVYFLPILTFSLFPLIGSLLSLPSLVLGYTTGYDFSFVSSLNRVRVKRLGCTHICEIFFDVFQKKAYNSASKSPLLKVEPG